MAKQISQPSAGQNVSHESIARRAYEIWQSEGCPDGRAMEHWLRAVSEVKRQSNGTEHSSTRMETAEVRAEEREPEMNKPRLPRRTPPRPAEKRFQTAGR